MQRHTESRNTENGRSGSYCTKSRHLSLSLSRSLSLSLALSLSIFDLIEAIIRHSPEATETFSVVGGRPGF